MHELTAREIFQETGRRFLHSDGRCASLTTPVPRFTTSGFRLRIATSSSAGLVAVLFLLRANIGPEALYTSRSLTNLSGTLSPTLRVEIVGEARSALPAKAEFLSKPWHPDEVTRFMLRRLPAAL